MINDLRLELRTRNNTLWHAIFDTAPSVAAFCRTHGLQNGTVGNLLNLTLSPWSTSPPNYRPLALRLSAITGIGLDTLFPATLYSGLLPHRLIAEVSSDRFLPLSAAAALALPASQEEAVLHREQQDLIAAALSTLTPREAKIISARYGLNGQDEQTRDALAASYAVSRERVRQLEINAMRRLRHPSRSRTLRHALPPYRTPSSDRPTTEEGV